MISSVVLTSFVLLLLDKAALVSASLSRISKNHPTSFVVFNGKLYFTEDAPYPRQMWSYDGNNAPSVVADVTQITPLLNVVEFKDKLYFPAFDDDETVLWSFDGTSPPSKAVNIRYPSDLSVFNDRLYFWADDDTEPFGIEQLWAYDGNNTTMVTDFTVDRIVPGPLAMLNDTAYFSFDGGLWSYDGTNQPSRVLYNVRPAKFLVPFNNKLYFARDLGTVQEVWVYDGIDPPRLATEVNACTMHTSPSGLVVLGSKLYYLTTELNTYVFTTEWSSVLWSYNGVDPPEIVGTVPYSSPGTVTAVYNDKIYFSLSKYNGGVDELWEYDPSTASTTSCFGLSSVTDYFRSFFGV